MYYVYMLKCKGNTIYTGITTDISRRISEHTSDRKRGARYTRSHKPEDILALWQCSDRSSASKLEYRIKTLSRPQKEQLAKSGDLSVFGDKIDSGDYCRITQSI